MASDSEVERPVRRPAGSVAAAAAREKMSPRTCSRTQDPARSDDPIKDRYYQAMDLACDLIFKAKDDRGFLAANNGWLLAGEFAQLNFSVQNPGRVVQNP